MGKLRVGLVLAALVGAASFASANGRNPGTSTIHFRAGSDGDVAAGMTFGLVVSHDFGATWTWICEDAIGYGGVYDPIYAYASTGTLFATTFNGLRVSRDGCTFDPLVSGSSFASTDTLGPDGTFFYGASNPSPGSGQVGDTQIYQSKDDGLTFQGVLPQGSVSNDWWQSIAVAPSDPSRVYLSGYRYDAQNVKELLLYRSVDGGSDYTPLATSAFTAAGDSALEILAVDPANPDVVYAHLTPPNASHVHTLYRSDDGGDHWTHLFPRRRAARRLDLTDIAFAFVLRANGDLLIGTQGEGTWVSHDRGDRWSEITTAPHINCLAENRAGEVWACTQNYSVMGGPPTDHAGIMKSTDGATWTPVLRYEDITAPVACGSGTVQYETCQVDTWCGLKMQLGITSTVLACAVAGGEQTMMPSLDLPVMKHPGSSGGCCDTGGADAGSRGTAALGAIGLALAWRRRRGRAC